MIQETYKISVQPGEDIATALRRLDLLLAQVGASEAYRQAQCVYVKLLPAQIPTEEAEDIGRRVRAALPKAVVTGMNLTLAIQEANEVYVVLSFCYFRESRVSLLRHEGSPEDYLEAGRRFGHDIARQKDVRAVEIFSVVMNIDLAPFVRGLSEEIPEIPIFGGLAGMNHRLENVDSLETFFDQENINVVFTNQKVVECFVLGEQLYETGIVLAVFSGKSLHVQADYLLGWTPVGKELTITEIRSNICAVTIDGIPAVEIYRKYLNVPADDRFLVNTCDFPMVFEREGCRIARTPPIFDGDGKLYFTGDIHAGEKFRLAYANLQELIRLAREGAGRMRKFCPQALFLVIAPNRSIFLGKEQAEELVPYEKVQPQYAVMRGPGEIYRYQGKGGVLNSSLVAVGMREGGCRREAGESDAPEPSGPSISIPLADRLAAFLDVTTKELQEMADNARAASVAKAQFLSNMSHEIRTPINAVMGMDEMILREATELHIREYAENIRLAGGNLLGLINDILDFSKIESGKMEIIPVVYELGSVLNDTAAMARGRAEQKDLNFSLSCAPGLPSILYGDEIRFKQVINNILNNAVQYTGRGFVEMSVDFEKQDEDTVLLRVSVKDSGAGIKEEDQQRLFAAFVHIETEQNGSVEGAGLGMNITQHLLSLMGSRLQLESVYGKGSEFSFVLAQKVKDWTPMGNFDEAYSRPHGKRQESSEPFIAPEARLLIVDDTAMNLTVAKGLLKRTRVQVDTAASGYECLDLVRQKKYDIIFLDHRMPGIDGIETLKQMKALTGSLNLDTPVVSLTANAVSGAREEYIAAGFQDYLTKPIDARKMESVVRKYLPPEKLVIRKPAPETAKKNVEEPGLSQSAILPIWLFRTEGLDTKEGISHCGSEEAYLEALKVFAESVVSGAKEIAGYIAAEDWENFTTKVHALKSTARIIGAGELSDRARYLEYAGNHRYISEIKNCADDLLQLYLAYETRLARLCRKEAAEEEKQPIGPEELADAYGAMREIAASFDYDSMMFLLDSLAGRRLPEADNMRISALRQAAVKPDWEAVRDLLGEVNQEQER